MISTWSHDQWFAFSGITTAGLAAVVLAALAIRAYRSWTAPAGVAAVQGRRGVVLQHAATRTIEAGYVPRPTLALAAARPSAAEVAEIEGRWRAAHAAGMTSVYPVIDPTGEITEHLAPGAGSLATLAEVGEGSIMRITHDDLVDPEVHKWFEEAFKRVLDDFHVAIGPAMQTARLWEVRGRGHGGVLGAGRAALDHWRAGTDTGAFPIVVPKVGDCLTLHDLALVADS